MRVSEVRRRADRGAAAVETALVLPMLLMVVFAMIDFGRMLNTQIRVTEAAREGARAQALVGEDEAGAIAATVLGSAASAEPDENGNWVAVSGKDCERDQRDTSYQIVYGFEFITPLGVFAGLVDDRVMHLNATAVMPCRA